jgi:predicted transcriptional regulator
MALANNEELIIRVLSRSNFATIGHVAQLTGLNRVTVSKYLSIMEAKGLIQHQTIGRSKLYAVVEREIA